MFSQNKFYLPLHEERLQNRPRLKLSAMVVAARTENTKDSELYGSARALGDCFLDIMPMVPELLDVYGTGIRRKLEFVRMTGRGDQAPAVVGRGSATLKLVGDYLSKFDSLGEGAEGAPKKAVGLLRQLPAERADFTWRMRCDVRAGSNMPLNDVVHQGLPSCFMEFGWSLTDRTADDASSAMPSSDMEPTVMCAATTHPNWNQ